MLRFVAHLRQGAHGYGERLLGRKYKNSDAPNFQFQYTTSEAKSKYLG